MTGLQRRGLRLEEGNRALAKRLHVYRMALSVNFFVEVSRLLEIVENI
jgi:hypothetical protein